MEVIMFYKNGKTEVVQDVVHIEYFGRDVVTITRKDHHNSTFYEVNILTELIQSIKIRYFK